MNYWKYTFIIIGGLPLIFIGSLLLFYFHAARILGEFPSYNNPDPKELSIYDFYSPLINFAGILWIASFVLWIALTLIYVLIQKKDVNLILLMFSTFSQLSAVFMFFSDIVEWYAD